MAGLVTAFGADSIAASLGVYSWRQQASLWALGVLLALYDGTEAMLKPVFGPLADRIGPRPVLLGGLLAFTIASAGSVVVGKPGPAGRRPTRAGRHRGGVLPPPARWSPGCPRQPPRAGVRRVRGVQKPRLRRRPDHRRPALHRGRYPLLFATSPTRALAATDWAALADPSVAPLARPRQTVLDLAQRLGSANFLQPTITLAGDTAALAVGVGSPSSAASRE